MAPDSSKLDPIFDDLRAHATATDLGDWPVERNVRLVADAGLLGMAISAEYGGIGSPRSAVFDLERRLAASCGTTTLVLIQAFGGIGQINRSHNEALKRRLLPEIAAGRRLVGVAFSHVRRPGPPMMVAEPLQDGYRFTGDAPWLTGWGMLDDVVLAGTLPDGRLVFAVVALDSPAIVPSPPIPLAGMERSVTVTIRCDGLLVPQDHVTAIMTRDELAMRDRAAVLRNAAYPLGVTSAALNHLCDLDQRHPQPALAAVIQRLQDNADRLTDGVRKWDGRDAEPGYYEAGLSIRSESIALGVRAAHAAVVASGGTANLATHPAQRLYREALVYSLVSQTPDVRTATLAVL